MKLQFKKQAFQSTAVEAVADCFAGQAKSTGIQYRIDPGRVKAGEALPLAFDESGFKNADFTLAQAQILENIRAVQRRQNLLSSSTLVRSAASEVNLDIEMETGTGKTYCYIKTMFELHKRYVWGKFIVVVPSIARRCSATNTIAT